MLFSHNRQKLLHRKTFCLFRDQEKKIPTSKQFPNTDFHIPCVMAWFGSLNCMKICLAQNKLNVVLTRFFFHLWEVGFFVGFEQENNIWHFSRTVFKCHLWNCEWAILIEADVTLPSLIKKMLGFLWQLTARGRIHHHMAAIFSQSFTRLSLFTVEQEDIMPWSSGTYLFNQGTISYFPYHTNDISVRNALMAIIGIIQFPHPLHTTSNVYCSTQKDQGCSSNTIFIWTNADTENITLFLAMALFHFSCSGRTWSSGRHCKWKAKMTWGEQGWNPQS